MSFEEAFEALCARAEREVDDRLPACQLAVARDGVVLGQRTFSRTGAETDDTRFPIWSVTKGIVAGLVWQLFGEGSLAPTDRVVDHLPSFGSNGKDVITVEQLLLHTAGIPLAPMGPRFWATSEGRRAAFARWRLNWEPGTQFEYHPLSAWWVLAELVVAATGNDYRDELRRRILEPLGLRALQLGVPAAEQGDIAPLSMVGHRATEEEHARSGVFYGGPPSLEVSPLVLHSVEAPAAREVGIPAGGAVSTAGDVARYYQALLHDPAGLWDADVLADGTGRIRNTFPDRPKWGMPANRTRGLVVRGEHDLAHWMMHFGPGTSPRTFGHDGAGGQIAWADPESGLSFCFLTSGMDANAVHEAKRCQDMAALAAACAIA
ncbi:MAG TPA: serine hydrolase domain-containing protein [Acidimicrobiales bacterium]|nr:serine hydrolase domain-containing protein [Acidimicrobiales bacterium]